MVKFAVQHAIAERITRHNPNQKVSLDAFGGVWVHVKARILWIALEDGDKLRLCIRKRGARAMMPVATFCLAEPDSFERLERELNSLGLVFKVDSVHDQEA